MMTSKTPVLLIVFNRFEEALEVFKSIKNYKPLQLFISSDGPRNEIEKEKVIKIRQYLIQNIDWDCEVKTKFNDVNLGCNLGPSSAISWFFSYVPSGIILEDDCVANDSFFEFCTKYLAIYKNEKRVWHISGSNLLGTNNYKMVNSEIIFSKFTFVWGWATWADRWEMYDSELSNFHSDDFIDAVFVDNKDRLHWKDIYKRVKMKELTSCWDYQWTFQCWVNDAISIVPRYNLIKNIGFGSDATHTLNPNPFLEKIKVYSVDLNHDGLLEKPIVNYSYDRKVQRYIFRQYFWIRLILKIYKLIKK